jgi:hypothetical protein
MWRARRAGKDQRIFGGSDLGGYMSLQLVDQDVGHRHGAGIRARLQWPFHQPAARRLGDASMDP